MPSAHNDDYKKLAGRFAGRTVVVIASGPSLSLPDLLRVQASGHPSIAVNTSYLIAPFARIVYSNDEDWYQTHDNAIRETMPHAERWCGHPRAEDLGLNSLRFLKTARGVTLDPRFITWGGNSGAAAIGLAHKTSPRKIVLLGFDQQWRDAQGRPVRVFDPNGDKVQGVVKHWHGDHPAHLKQGNNWPLWAEHFAAIADDFRKLKIDVVNCSRETSLECFRRSPLEKELLC